jgi:NAD(P)-dependent dehydrogenase (short-subunit alcohol dehydrogenase family)
MNFAPEGLNVLCNNAGIMAFRDEPTIDGYDVQMQTNHLSHFLLTKLLMPKLEEAAEKYGEARVGESLQCSATSAKGVEK